MTIVTVGASAFWTKMNDLCEWIIASMNSEDFMIVVADLAVNTHFYIPKLIQYLELRKMPFKYVTTVEELQKLTHIACVILTGSDLFVSDIPNHRRVHALLNFVMALPKHVMRIGICFGSQYLYVYAGGKLERLPRAICSTRNIHTELPVENVQFCLHEVFVDPVPAELEMLAMARLGNKMRPCAFKYKNKPWYGFLFHPEANRASWKIFDKLLAPLNPNG